MPDHPSEDHPVWLVVGQMGKAHGVHGSILAEIMTDFPERIQPGVEVGLGESQSPERNICIHDVRYHRGRWLLDLVGIRSREEVEELRGLYLFLPEQALEDLPEGYYYEHHLVGLECRSPEGDVLGEVRALDTEGGQTRILVRRDTREFLVPWVPELIPHVDLEESYLVIRHIPGLLDDEAVIA